MDTNLPTSNMNPGDLKFAGQANATQGKAGFASFDNPQDGFGGLLNDIQAKINKNPNDTLADFANVYAPPSDNNNSAQYAADLANQLGVAPNATIGSLEPKIGQFADAIAKNEGYQGSNDPTGLGGVVNTAESLPSQIGTPATVAGGIGGVAGLGAAVLGGSEALAGEVGNGVKGILGDIGLGSLFSGSSSNSSSSDTSQSPVYQAVQNQLSSTVGGNKVLQEAQDRNTDPISMMEQTGNVPQPDENGNLDKETPINNLQSLASQDTQAKEQMVGSMPATTSTTLGDVEKDAFGEAESDAGKSGLGLSDEDRDSIKKQFESFASRLPKQYDKNGKQLSLSQMFITPQQLEGMRKIAVKNSKDFTAPHNQRKMSVHTYHAMSKRMSQIAKQHNIKGWDETNKRIETALLAIKAIEKMPKKAQRNLRKEFGKDVLASTAGGLIAKTLGTNSLVGSVIGHLIETKLGKKEYQKTGSSKERKEMIKRQNTPQKSLLSREK